MQNQDHLIKLINSYVTGDGRKVPSRRLLYRAALAGAMNARVHSRHTDDTVIDELSQFYKTEWYPAVIAKTLASIRSPEECGALMISPMLFWQEPYTIHVMDGGVIELRVFRRFYSRVASKPSPYYRWQFKLADTCQ